MKCLICALFVLLSSALSAQNPWQPTPGHTQIPIWPGPVPDAQPTDGLETMESTGTRSLVAGKPWLAIERVTQPTMTVYAPRGKNSRAAIIVFPGGGYEILAIDLEGTEVCDWLTAKGITCVLLKYRVPAPRSAPDWGAYPQSHMALEDAQRTISLVRSRARDLNVDPHKIGVMGFSAGGHLVAATSVHFSKRIYKETDVSDEQSCRPDFAIAIYPGHLSRKEGTLDLNPDIAGRISAQTPPTFLLQNENDDSDTIWDSLSYYAALIKAHVPVEFHSYAEGGHAFGLRRTKYAATGWPSLAETWLHSIGVLNDQVVQPPSP